MEGFESFADIADEQILAEESCPIDQVSHSTGRGTAYAIRRGRSVPRGRSNSSLSGQRFTLRAGGNLLLENGTLTQLTEMIRNRPRARDRRELMISAGGAKLVSCAAFAQLTGLDMVSAEEELPSGAYIGSLAENSVTAMFARIQEHRSTGRLVIVTPRGAGAKKVRTELQVVRGQPTHIATSEAGLETPWQLIRDRVVDAEQMRAAVFGAISSDRPFAAVIAERLGLEVARLEHRFAAERLFPIAAERNGTFALSSVTPVHTQPIARSLLPFLPVVFRRGVGIEQLEARVVPLVTGTFLRTTRFESWLPELRLSAEENAAVSVFGCTRTLGMAIASIDDEHFALAMAHLLIELGMIAAAA